MDLFFTASFWRSSPAFRLGFVMALSPVVRDYVNPWMATLYTTPRIAFAPVLLLWFGIGGGSKIAIVFGLCVSDPDQFLLRHARGQSRIRRACPFFSSPSAGRCSSKFYCLLPYRLSSLGIRLAIGARSRPASPSPNGSAPPRASGYLVFFAGQTLNVPTLFVGVAAVRPAREFRFRAGPTI